MNNKMVPFVLLLIVALDHKTILNILCIMYAEIELKLI